MPETVTFVGSFEHCIHHSRDTGFTVAKYRRMDTQKTVTVVGYDLPISRRTRISITGVWVTREGTAERQVKAISFEYCKDADKECVTAYLKSLKAGIGERKASDVYLRFKGEFWSVLEKDPYRLTEVRGITQNTVDKVVEAMKKQGEIRELMQLLSGTCIDPSVSRVTRIIKRLGQDAAKKIHANPYCLCGVDGITFDITDRYAAQKGVPKDDPHRILAGVSEVFSQQAKRGNVCVEKNRLVEILGNFLMCSPDLCRNAVNALYRHGMIRQTNNMLYAQKKYTEETSIVTHIQRLMDAERAEAYDVDPLISDYEQENFPLAEKQREAIRMVFRSNVSIITGGPGVGKTTVIRALLSTFEKVYGCSAEPVLLAPTGRAARRMAEATGYPASTIHSAVGIREDGMSSSDEPLRGTLFVVDETSMMDQNVASILLERIPTGAAVVFVGDPCQLPSVGCGNVLMDMIDSKVVPTTVLDVIFRQAKDNPIVSNAYDINNGNSDLLYTKTFKFVERSTSEETFKAAFCMYVKAVQAYGIDDVILLTPYRKNGILSVNYFNKQLQNYLNPVRNGDLTVSSHGIVFRVNDKVMQRRNTSFVQNGDIGYVRNITRKPDEQNPREWIYTVEVEFNGDGVMRAYSEDQLEDLDLAFCSTIHKSQGQEYHTVIMVVSEEHKVMLQRNIIYTGVTRARVNVALIGQKTALKAAVANNKATERCTLLAERLRSCMSSK